jgi:hypothetical protein
MHGTHETSSRIDWQGGLKTPRRNRFFHGKMMDVYHFEMETGYGIGMRRLLNRLVSGYGVVCGLDVVRGDDPCSVRVTPGLALDGWGGESVVPTETRAVPIPAGLIDRVCGGDDHDEGDDSTAQTADRPEQSAAYEGERIHRHRRHDDDDDDEACVTAVLCYRECESDPVTVLAGDCSTSTPCAPGAIREQYHVAFEPGCTDPIEVSCRFPDVLRHGELDYGALARWVTQECADPPRNPCVPLANLRLDCRDDGCEISDIEIEIRPVVYGNDIIVDILSRIVEEGRAVGADDRRRRR